MSNIFMKVDNITGNITAGGYDGCILLDNIKFNINRSVRTRVGYTAERDTAAPQFSDLLISKQLDKSSCNLFQLTCAATVIPQVEIHVCTTDETLQPYVKYLLTNVMISDYNQMTYAGSLPLEQAKLNFTQIQTTYLGQANANNTVIPTTVGYDITTAKLL